MAGDDNMLFTISLFMMLVSVITSFFCGRTEGLLSAFFSGGYECVSYCLKICGSMCLFSGFMRIAEDCGLTKTVAKFFRPFVKYVIPSAMINSETENAVVMNFTSNLFGLGNAATPFGIKAAQNMYLLNKMKSPNRSLASFIILNTSSLCLVPSTVITVMQSYGSVDFGSIVVSVIIVQALSCIFGLFIVRMVFKE